MGGPGGRPVADGAASVVWAATLSDSGPTGGFFRDGDPLPWLPPPDGQFAHATAAPRVAGAHVPDTAWIQTMLKVPGTTRRTAARRGAGRRCRG